jgi:hypothetical protein
VCSPIRAAKNGILAITKLVQSAQIPIRHAERTDDLEHVFDNLDLTLIGVLDAESVCHLVGDPSGGVIWAKLVTAWLAKAGSPSSRAYNLLSDASHEPS